MVFPRDSKLTNIASLLQSDVGTHFVEYNSISELTTVYASERTLSKLNDAQVAALKAAMTKASNDFFAYNRENDEVFGQKLIDKGYTVLRLSDEEQAAMAAHVQETVWPSMAKNVGQDLIVRLLAPKQ